MNINPEADLDLEKLFLPAWAQEPAKENRYERYEPRDRPERGDRRGPPGRRDQGERPRRDFREGGREGGRPPRDFGGRERRGGPQRDERGGRPEHREPPPPLPELEVALRVEEKGAESLARQIRTTGRAYPLFDIAAMILQKSERFQVVFTVCKGEGGQPKQRLFSCALDGTVWLSADEAVAHVLRSHLATFYQAERTQTDPPKGTYTFVAQCSLSGVILGPPNHHDYQTKLRELHARRFARMPFEVYKSRVRIVRDEAVVKQWIEEQSWRTEYLCLNVPDPLRLLDLDAVEKHFREVHQSTIINEVETHALSGQAAQRLRGGLFRLYRGLVDQQRRFPMQLATSLSQQFASRGLQFFKVNKTVTHVWIARPTYLDLENEPVSETIRRIVLFINERPKCTRRQLVESLAPSPAAVPPPTPRATAEGVTTEAPATSANPPAAPASEPATTPEQTAIISDLHWLVHQGHVIEFANGTLETAKKPAPRPTKPEKALAVSSPAAADSATASRSEPVVASTDSPPPAAPSAEPVAEAAKAAEPGQAEAKPATEVSPEATPHPQTSTPAEPKDPGPASPPVPPS